MGDNMTELNNTDVVEALPEALPPREVTLVDVANAIETVGFFLNQISIPATMAPDVVATGRVLASLQETVKRALTERVDA
jgi:hypothetical protein